MIVTEQLLEISIRLSAERNLDRLLNLIIEQTNTLLAADRSTLFLVNEEEDCLESKVAQGMQAVILKVPMNRGVAGWVAEHKQALSIKDVQHDDRHYSLDASSFPVRSMLCVPLLDAELQLHGVMQAMRLQVNPFSEEEETLLRAMASLATVAIRNALLNQQMEMINAELERKVEERTQALNLKNIELERIAITDALTGAYNRRHFDQTLIQEHRLSHRYGETFSLVMFDIDFFKKVNDSLGHDAGDAVLSQLTEVVQGMLRDCDFLFRYGGEEFVLLLPRTGLKGAKQLAERICLAVAQHEFNYSDQEVLNITVSLGVASWHKEERTNAEVLLKQADSALYHSKENGRNQVSIA